MSYWTTDLSYWADLLWHLLPNNNRTNLSLADDFNNHKWHIGKETYISEKQVYYYWADPDAKNPASVYQCRIESWRQSFG